MLTASGNFAVQMGKRRMRVAGQFTIAVPDVDYLDFSKVLKTISLDAQNTTDLPDGVRDIAGFASQGGSAVLAGKVGRLKHQTVAWLLNPDEPTSPMYRQQVKGSKVTFAWGVRVRGSASPELLQTFTGRVTTLHHDHVAGSVTIGLVDLSVDWTDLPETPAVVTAPPYNAGLTSEFPMDNVVRYFEGASSWPAKRPQCILAVGARSSLTAEVGQLDGSLEQVVPAFTRGANGTAYAGAAPGVTSFQSPGGPLWNAPAYVIDDSASPLTNAIAFEATVTGTGAIVGGVNTELRFGQQLALFTLPGLRQLYKASGLTVSITDTNIVVATTGGSDVWTVTLDATPHTLLFWASVSGGTMTCHAKIDGGAVHNFAGITWVDDMTLWNYAQMFAATGTTVEAWITSTETAPVTSYPFTPVAVLDPSLNPLTVVPEIAAGTKGWDELQTMAAAEGGYAYRDGQGVFRFLNRNTIAQSAIGRTLSSLVSLKSLETDQGGSTEYDAVNASFTDWNIGTPGLLWTLGSKKRIGAGQTVTWVQTLGDGVLAAKLDTVAAVLPDGHAFDDGNTWYRASADSAGVNPFGGTLIVTVQQVTSGSVRISVVNKSTQAAYLVSPSTFSETDLLGQPALWIGGIPAIQGDEATVTASIGAGTTPLALSSNPYWQDHDALVAFLQHVLAQVYVSIRDFTNVAIVPDARIEIADRDLLQDAARSKVNEYIQIWGSSINFDFTKGSESWEQTLNVRALAGPGGWIGEVAGRSEGQLTTWGF